MPMNHPIPLFTDHESLPTAAGAYLLLIVLNRSIALPPRFDGLCLGRGHYLYAGNAYGRGGIRSRCRRHLYPDKARHWHVDWLTGKADEVRAAAFPGGNECTLIRKLSRRPGVQIPVSGFGSTDCKQCPSHLVRVDSCDMPNIRQSLSA